MSVNNTTAGDAHATHPEPNYAVIFGSLLVLTVATVGLSRVEMGYTGNFLLAMAVASVKGLLVAAYFMHLKFEKVVLIAALLVPFFYAVALVIGLLPDLFYGSFGAGV